MKIDTSLNPIDLSNSIARFWDVSAQKIGLLDAHYDPSSGSPVFTANGAYTTRGWTEWTQGFQYGGEILQFDATGDETFLSMGSIHSLRTPFDPCVRLLWLTSLGSPSWVKTMSTSVC
jgi:unsaturated chondroitin disaccharide hydrolase